MKETRLHNVDIKEKEKDRTKRWIMVFFVGGKKKYPRVLNIIALLCP